MSEFYNWDEWQQKTGPVEIDRDVQAQQQQAIQYYEQHGYKWEGDSNTGAGHFYYEGDNGEEYVSPFNVEYDPSPSISISINKETGDIDFNAPSYILERQAIKENIIPQLEKISLDYKNNGLKDVNYIQENNSSKSTADLLNDITLKISSKDFIQNAQRLNTEQKEIAADTGKQLSDEEIERYQNNESVAYKWNTNRNALTNEDRIYIPKTEGVNLFDMARKLGSYDETTGTVGAQDFRDNVYNREKISDEDYFQARESVKNRLVDNDIHSDNVDTDDWTRNVAMAYIFTDATPTEGIARGTGDFLTNLAMGISLESSKIVEEIDKNVMSFVGGIFNGGDFQKAYDDASAWFKKGLDASGTLSRHEAKTNALTTSGSVGLSIGKLTSDVAYTTAAIEIMTVLAGAGLGAAGSVVGKLTNGEKAAEFLGALGLNGKPAFFATKFLQGVGTTMKAANPAEAASAFSKAMQITSGVVNHPLSKGARALASIYADAVVFNTVYNADNALKVIRGSEDPAKAAGEIFAQSNQDLLFGAAFGGGGKIISKTGETVMGRALSANFARKLNGIGFFFHKASDKLKTIFKKDFDNQIVKLDEQAAKGSKKALEKSRTLKQREEMWGMRKELSDADRVKYTEVATGNTKSLDNVEEKILETRAMNNVFTSNLQSAKVEMKKFRNNKINEEAYNNFAKSRADLVKASKQESKNVIKYLKSQGKSRKEINKTIDELFKKKSSVYEGQVFGLVGNVQNRYIRAKNELVFLNNIAKERGYKLVPEEKWSKLKQGEYNYNKRMADAIANVRDIKNYGFSKDYIKMLESSRKAENQLYERFNDYYGGNNEYNLNVMQDNVFAAKNSGLWRDSGGELNFASSPRIQDKRSLDTSRGNKQKYVMERERNLAVAPKGEYIDPSLSVAHYEINLADKLHRASTVQKYSNITGAKIIVGASKTAAAREASQSNIKKAFRKLDKKINNFAKNGVISDETAAKIKLGMKEKKELGTKLNDVSKIKSELQHITKDGTTTTRTQRSESINSMEPSQRQTFWGKHNDGYQTITDGIEAKIDKTLSDIGNDADKFSEWKNGLNNYEKSIINRIDDARKQELAGLQSYSTKDLERKIKDTDKKYAEYMIGEIEFYRWRKELSNGSKKDLDNMLQDHWDNIGAIGKDGDHMSYHNYKNMTNSNLTAEDDLMSSIMSKDKKYVDDDEFVSAINKSYKQNQINNLNMRMQSEQKGLKEMLRKYGDPDNPVLMGEFFDEISSKIDDTVDEFILDLLSEPEISEVIGGLVKAAGEEVGHEYLVLRMLKEHRIKTLANDVETKAWSIFRKRFDADGGAKLTNADQKVFSEYVKNEVKDAVEQKLESNALALKAMKSSLVDQDYLFEKINKINRDIAKAEGDIGKNIVPMSYSNGDKVYMEIPENMYDIFMRGSIYDDPGKINAAVGIMNKLFRLGTTALSIRSWVSQLCRDGINAFVGGGLYNMMADNRNYISDVFGDNIIEQIDNINKQWGKRIRQEAQEIAEKNPEKFMIKGGKNTSEEIYNRALRKQATDSYINNGLAEVPEMTQMEAERFRTQYSGAAMSTNGAVDSRTLIQKAQDGLDRITREKFISNRNGNITIPNPLSKNGKMRIANPAHLNEWREDFMRRKVFEQAFSDGLKRGYSVDRARVFATDLMHNAITDFTRPMKWFNNIRKSVPYLGAAINGYKSFWHLVSLDPVGVMGRFMGGLVLPYMGLLSHSLSNEENRKIYMNIPEYAKQDNAVFVINGQPVSIPIPQEMAGLVAPFRQLVEFSSNAGSKTNNGWDLFANNMIGLQPLNLQGFVNLDGQKLADGNIQGWLSRGVGQLASQLMPPTVKSAVALATGYDLYSGKPVDTSYVRIDDEGNPQVVDNASGQFVKSMGDAFGDFGKYGAQILTNGIIGRVGTNILDWITGVIQGNSIAKVGSDKILGDISAPFIATSKSKADVAWTDAVRQLKSEKAALMDSDEYKKLNAAAQSYYTSDSAKENVQNQLRTYFDGYFNHVKTAVNRLNSVYGAEFDRHKLAAVISLMNTNAGGGTNSNSIMSSLGDELNQHAKRQAIQTMVDMGFKDSNDGSVFGYTKKNKDGSYSFDFYDPLTVLNAKNIMYNQQSLHEINIKNMFDDNNFKEYYKNIKSQLNDAYSTKDYKKQDELKMALNAETMKKLYPYLEHYGLNSVLNNNEILRGTVSKYLQVPSEYEKVKNRYVSSGNGKLNKQQAFLYSYLQSLYNKMHKDKGGK